MGLFGISDFFWCFWFKLNPVHLISMYSNIKPICQLFSIRCTAVAIGAAFGKVHHEGQLILFSLRKLWVLKIPSICITDPACPNLTKHWRNPLPTCLVPGQLLWWFCLPKSLFLSLSGSVVSGNWFKATASIGVKWEVLFWHHGTTCFVLTYLPFLELSYTRCFPVMSGCKIGDTLFIREGGRAFLWKVIC